jgi:Polyketide cyclase / dehydrase and lipid transport
MADSTKGAKLINEKAPVVGWSEIEIEAAPEVAWNVLTAIGRWPDWNPAVKSVGFEEGIDEGSEFRWKAGRTPSRRPSRRSIGRDGSSGPAGASV